MRPHFDGALVKRDHLPVANKEFPARCAIAWAPCLYMRYQAAALANIVMQKLFKRQQTSSATLKTNPCTQLSAQATTNCVPAPTTASGTTLQQLVSVHMQQCNWEAAQKEVSSLR